MEQPRLLDVSPQNPTSAKRRHERIMGHLKDTIFTTLSASNPSGTITQDVKSRIEDQLHAFFPHFRTPTHPPYALMIRSAIIELNEEAGSSEESISGFIRKEYVDLPWGHAAFLCHHLRKLCMSGEIVCKNDGRYMIVVDHGDTGDKEEMGQRINPRQIMWHSSHVGDDLQNELKEIGEETRLIKQKIEEYCQAKGQENEMNDDRNKVNEKQIEVFEEQHAAEKQEVEASRQDIEATVQQIERSSVELKDGKNYPQNEPLEVIEEPNPLKEPQFEVSEDYTLMCGQQNKVIEEQNILHKQQIEVMNERKREDKVLVTIPSASEIVGECFNSNGLSSFLKDQLMENLYPSGRMELSKHDVAWPVMEEENKYYLKVEQQQLTKSHCTERASNVEVIAGQTQLQEQEDRLIREESQIQVETEVMRLCFCSGDGVTENSSAGESPLPVFKVDQKEYLNLEHPRQQTKSSCGEWKFSIICGLLAQQQPNDQQKAPKSRPDNGQLQRSRRPGRRRLHRHKLDADKTTSVLLPSDHPSDHRHDIEQKQHHQHDIEQKQHHQHDIEQKQHHQLEGQGRPSKPEGNGDHHGNLRIYVRRRRKS